MPPFSIICEIITYTRKQLFSRFDYFGFKVSIPERLLRTNWSEDSNYYAYWLRKQTINMNDITVMYDIDNIRSSVGPYKLMVRETQFIEHSEEFVISFMYETDAIMFRLSCY